MITFVSRSHWLFLPKNWVWILLLCFSNSLVGQMAKFEFFSSADHLSSPNPWLMTQDKEGFLWILGLGIDRYDGYNFVNVKNMENVYADYNFDDKYYLSSNDHFISKSEDHFYLRQIKTGQIDSIYYGDLLAKNQIANGSFFHELANGEYVFFLYDTTTTQTSFLTLVDGQLENRFAKKDNSLGMQDGSFKVASDKQGNFYYENEHEDHIVKIDSEGNLLDKISFPPGVERISVLKMGDQNTLFIGDKNDLFFLKEGAKKFERHIAKGQNYLSDILELPNGDLWACGDDRTLVFYDHSKNEAFDFTSNIKELIPRKVDLWNILQDKTGVLWINTILGVIKIVPQQTLFDTYFSGPNEECGGYCSFRGITENEHGQIFASFYNSIFQINPFTKTVEKPFPRFHNTPMGLGYDKGHLLLNNGERYNTLTKELDKAFTPFLFYDFDTGSMAQDNLGNWWNAHFDDVWFLDVSKQNPKWEKLFKIPASMKRLYLHYGKKSTQLWIADGHQLFNYNTKNNKLSKYFSLPEGENIYSIYEGEKNEIWLGTADGLVNVETRKKPSKRYTIKDGLPHNLVCGILSEGDSCLWLATNYGLSRFSKASEGFTNFYTEDGLTHNEFNRGSAYKAKDGQMFFGGMQGINAFYPKELMKKYRKQKNIGKVLLSSVSHINEKLDTTLTNIINLNKSDLEFFHWDKSITFEFCLSDYRKSTKNKFSYLLEGYDKVWSNPSPYNFAKYSSLPSGDYVFRVKAFDAKGYWNPNKLAIPIKVYPPWWKTTFAYLMYGLVFCSIFYGIYRNLRYRLELKSQYQYEQKEAQRLKDLSSFKNRLFTNLTHEFRTPLTMILGMAKQLSKETQELKIDKNLKNTFASQTQLIEQNGQALLRLVNQLLDLSKLENNAFQINLQNDDILPFLNYSVSSFQSFANQHNLTLKFSTKLDLLNMDFDRTLLQQVMTNLISNAIKFTESGGDIKVKVNRLQKNKKELLQIKIQDTGIGIRAEKLSKIFDRFYQVDSSITRIGEGTGIGLAHTKELINVMNGEIQVTSEEGIGTEFIVLLPIENKVAVEIKTEEFHSDQAKTIIPIISKPALLNTVKVGSSLITPGSTLPKLLLIEDNPGVVTYLQTCLRSSYQIEVAYNGKIGIEKALQHIPDLIISDVMMPEKDGFEVCDFLKNDEKTSHIPIILLTAKADYASKIDGLKRGADAYLSKPFDEDELKVRLQSLLERQQRLVNYFSTQNDLTTTDLPESSNLPTKESIQIEHAFIQKVVAILEENYEDNDFGLPQLCQKIGMSRSQLYRKIKALTDTSPSSFIRSYRLKKAKILLETSSFNVSEVAWKTGFVSLPHFSKVFQEEFGMTPSTTSN